MPPSVAIPSEGSSDGRMFVPLNELRTQWQTDILPPLAPYRANVSCHKLGEFFSYDFFHPSPFNYCRPPTSYDPHSSSTFADPKSLASRTQSRPTQIPRTRSLEALLLVIYRMTFAPTPVVRRSPLSHSSLFLRQPIPTTTHSLCLGLRNYSEPPLMRNGEASSPAFIFPQPSESVHSLPLEPPTSSLRRRPQLQLNWQSHHRLSTLDFHSYLRNQIRVSSWHDIAAAVRPRKGPRRKRRILTFQSFPQPTRTSHMRPSLGRVQYYRHPQKPNPRVARYVATLADLNVELKHLPGIKLKESIKPNTRLR